MARLWFALVLLPLLVAGVGKADWFDWTNGVHRVQVTDPADVFLPNSAAKDILGVWWGRDLAYDYFRLDLAANPSLGDSAEIYGIYIFSTPGQGAPYTNAYVPHDPTYDGVDQVVDNLTLSGNLFLTHQYNWNPLSIPPTWDTALVDFGGNYAHLLTSGTGIEWLIPLGMLPGEFGFRGGTLSPGSGTTFDVTDQGFTPEPGTWLLLALGLPALVWYRRSRR